VRLRSTRFVLTGVALVLTCGALSGFAVAAPAEPASTTLALAALDRRIADLDAEEEANKRELGAIAVSISEAHARTIARGKNFYRLTRAGMLPVGGGFDALVTHAMRVERTRHVLASDLASERALRARGAELAGSLERGAHDRIALSSQRTSMDAARIAVADENRRQEAFDKAFESSAGPGEFVAVSGGGGATLSDVGSSGGFQASRGRLLFPVLGKTDVIRPARREGMDGPGLEIHAPMSSTVRAVYTGRIAFADRYGSYGRIVIVDHGDHYYSVSGNLSSIDVRVGDEVAAGDKLGAVGDEGQGPMLYFEIRHGSQTIAPAPWLGL
jgi:murein DD-endopeptidase MepM/ murein hydrolase activator NlpD